MLPKSVIAVVAILTLATLACSLTIDLPDTNLRTGPEQTEEIRVPFPEGSEVVDLTLAFGAGKLRVEPGAERDLVEGTAVYNVLELRPDVTVSGSRVRIETGEIEIRGLPDFNRQYRNDWELMLSDARPLRLVINAGAYEGRFELGGLPLVDLRVADGAADSRMRFSEPNPVEMETLRYDTGASSVELEALANANFSTLIFKGGAGDYRLDFSGQMQRDATVNIDSGISSVEVIVPEGTNARLLFDGGLTDVDLSGAWEKEGDMYFMPGEGPRLTINVNMGAGSLQLSDH